MNSTQTSSSAQHRTRESLGVVAKLVAVIVATFVFAAFSREPAQPHSKAAGVQSTSAHTPNQPR